MMNNLNLTGLRPVEMVGIVNEDYSSDVNDLFVNVEFTNNISVRVAVDMDFKDIDFNNMESISETMLKKAWEGAYVQYAQDLIDDEVIDGEFGFDYEIEDPEDGEWETIKNYDVSQFHDIILMTPQKDRGVIAKRLLEVKGVLDSDDSDNSDDSESKVYLVNAFTPNMLDIETIASGFNVEFTHISKEEGLNLMTDSAIGHEDFAKVLGVPYNRINLKLKRGDVFVLAQRVGERLPEGTTTLTEDVNAVFLKGVVQ